MWTHGNTVPSKQSGNVTIVPISFGDTGAIDAFARIRVSDPYTLFDSKQIFDDPDIANSAENYPLFYDNQQTSGGGTTTTFNVNRASTTLAVSANTAGKRVRQTKQRFNYQPGKSMLVILTGLAGNTSSGVTKRLGYFDDNNGLFYQDVGGTWSVVQRSFVTGAAVDTPVSQANWNIDPLDGTGPSGITLDPLATQILFLDFEWLGVGRVRFGFFVDGLPYYCHEFLNSNNLTSVYMSNPNLPIRASIENDGTGGADSMEQICSTVISEGGNQPNGTFRFQSIGSTVAARVSAATIGTIYALCGIRLKSAYLAARVNETFISVIENTGSNNPFLWRLHLNPTLTTGLTYSDVSNSAVQFGVGLAAGDVITNVGTILAGGYQSRADATASVSLESALRLGSTIAGVSDQLVLSASPITANQGFYGGMQWREAW